MVRSLKIKIFRMIWVKSNSLARWAGKKMIAIVLEKDEDEL